MKNIPYNIALLLITFLFSCNPAKEPAGEKHSPKQHTDHDSQTGHASGDEHRSDESHSAASNEEAHSQAGHEEGHPEESGLIELSAAQYANARIETGPLEKKNLSNVFRVNGVLDVPPQSLASVSTPLGGFVRATELLPGSRVRKGEAIATVENADFIQIQQEYLEAQSRLEYLQQEYNRQEELYRENVASAKNFQQVSAEYKATQARVAGLKERLRLIGINPARLSATNLSRTVSVYAPITGYVTAVNVNIGRYVQPTDVMFTIANTEHLHVELTVFEKDVVKLRKGQKVRFTLPNESTRERTATIYLIGREITPDRTVRVHAHMDQEDTQLLPGLFVSALVELDGSQVPALPEEAIVQSEGRHYVFIAKGKREEDGQTMHNFLMMPVEKGISDGGFAAVTLPDSLSGKPIVRKGAYSLLSKAKNTEEEGHGH